jgi:hypothetical protein
MRITAAQSMSTQLLDVAMLCETISQDVNEHATAFAQATEKNAAMLAAGKSMVEVKELFSQRSQAFCSLVARLVKAAAEVRSSFTKVPPSHGKTLRQIVTHVCEVNDVLRDTDMEMFEIAVAQVVSAGQWALLGAVLQP